MAVEAEVKEKRWWLKGTISVEVATEVIKFLSNMTKVSSHHTTSQFFSPKANLHLCVSSMTLLCCRESMEARGLR